MTPARHDVADCERFERWLDAGMPAGAHAPEARAGECERCRRAWHAGRALDALLAQDSSPAPNAGFAPAGFADAVMRRVAATRRTVWVPFVEDPLPWWVRAAMQPAAAMAAVLAGVMVWRWNDLLAVARAAAATTSSWSGSGFVSLVIGTWVAMEAAFGRVLAVWSARDPSVHIGLALALVPAMLLLSTRLAQWGEHIAMDTGSREPTVH